MRFYDEKTLENLKKRNENAIIFIIIFAVVCCAFCALYVVFRGYIGTVIAQISATLFSTALLCAIITVIRDRAENKKLASFYSLMVSADQTISGTFVKEGGTLTKNGLTFRQIFISQNGLEIRLLAHVTASPVLPAAGETVSFITADNMIAGQIL